jgi:hypothetical protein
MNLPTMTNYGDDGVYVYHARACGVCDGGASQIFIKI